MIKIVFAALIVLIMILGTVVLVKNSAKPQSPPPDPIAVTQTSPFNGEDKARLMGEITIRFSRALTIQEQKDIQIEVSPSLDFQRSFREGSYILILSPRSTLQPQQRYEVSIKMPQLTYNFSFTTGPGDKTSQETIQNQNQINEASDEAAVALKDKYPWLEHLPLQTSEFYVDFETSDETFNAQIYLKEESTLTPDEQADALQGEIKQRLTDLGIDLKQYNIDWEIK